MAKRKPEDGPVTPWTVPGVTLRDVIRPKGGRRGRGDEPPPLIKKPPPTIAQRWERHRRAMAAQYGGGLSKQEIRIRWLKRCHERVRLMKKFPEVDWYRPMKDARRTAGFARIRAARAAKAT